jgi:hypothetical protein
VTNRAFVRLSLIEFLRSQALTMCGLDYVFNKASAVSPAPESTYDCLNAGKRAPFKSLCFQVILTEKLFPWQHSMLEITPKACSM